MFTIIPFLNYDFNRVADLDKLTRVQGGYKTTPYNNSRLPAKAGSNPRNYLAFSLEKNPLGQWNLVETTGSSQSNHQNRTIGHFPLLADGVEMLDALIKSNNMNTCPNVEDPYDIASIKQVQRALKNNGLA